jgi:hypothetical protein
VHLSRKQVREKRGQEGGEKKSCCRVICGLDGKGLGCLILMSMGKLVIRFVGRAGGDEGV